MTQPYIEYVDQPPPRQIDEPISGPALEPPPKLTAFTLIFSGVALLLIGFTALTAVNFVADQFARAPWLGWLTAVMALVGFCLVAAGIWRELRALFTLSRVDHIRADLQSGDPARIMAAAQVWSARLPAGQSLQPALRTLNDPDAALALLRAGPVRELQVSADQLARNAAVQTVAGIAAMPSPALDVLLIAWRGTRLVRQTAVLYGVRPGLLGTVSLLRRTALSATMVGAAELAGNTAAHAFLSNPLLTRAIGEAAGAGIAARRMLVLGRAAASACNPVPPS